ncbi:hypothetical protein AYY26_02120 [Photobacterium phosphoreum]|uniref:DUF2513 domain-containing protein n=1 Tax=Photobacterium phosphoreum TaxID=659 RepID=UPI0007F95B09|nr:DUF2513 domain-containing protein [Photobacterium phosphoreum]OBU45227.1 hypothetical protein AYY26_02120 [Photobacterium phosphoreum]
MKIDYEYIKLILTAFTESNNPCPLISEVAEKTEGVDNKFAFHLNVLFDYRFIEIKNRTNSLSFDYDEAGSLDGWCDFNFRLTAQGHEFHSTLQQKEFWAVVKSELKDNSIDTVWKIGKDILSKIATKKAEKLIFG